MMKVDFILVALLMVLVRIVSCEISTREVSSPSLAPGPNEEHSSPPQSISEMSPSRSPSNSESISPTMPNYYNNPPPSQSPDSGDFNHSGDGENGGGKKAGIAVGAIAAASMIGVGGYVLKKRRENVRRSRYGYAATEFSSSEEDK